MQELESSVTQQCATKTAAKQAASLTNMTSTAIISNWRVQLPKGSCDGSREQETNLSCSGWKGAWGGSDLFNKHGTFDAWSLGQQFQTLFSSANSDRYIWVAVDPLQCLDTESTEGNARKEAKYRNHLSITRRESKQHCSVTLIACN